MLTNQSYLDIGFHAKLLNGDGLVSLVHVFDHLKIQQIRNQHFPAKISKFESTNDSISYKIELENDGKLVSANLSVSVLSREHKNFEESQNIKSAFLLSPYVNGFIENPAYYFNRKNNDRRKALDLLLLTQGWSGYSLKDMISELNPRLKYNAENGISLKGQIEGTLYTNNFGLITNKDQLIDWIFLDGKKQFEFEKLLLYTGDTIKFSFLDQQNNSLKPKKIAINSIKQITPNLPLPRIKNNLDNSFEKKENMAWYTEGLNQLEEVKVTGKKRSKKFIRRKKLHEKYRSLVWDIGKYYEIPVPSEHKTFKDSGGIFASIYPGSKYTIESMH